MPDKETRALLASDSHQCTSCLSGDALSVALHAHHNTHKRSRERALRLPLCAAFSLQFACLPCRHPCRYPPSRDTLHYSLLCSRVSPAATQYLRSPRAPAQGWPQPVRHWQAREHHNKCGAVSVCHDTIRLLWSITPSEQSLHLESKPKCRAVFVITVQVQLTLWVPAWTSQRSRRLPRCLLALALGC